MSGATITESICKALSFRFSRRPLSSRLDKNTGSPLFQDGVLLVKAFDKFRAALQASSSGAVDRLAQADVQGLTQNPGHSFGEKTGAQAEFPRGCRALHPPASVAAVHNFPGACWTKLLPARYAAPNEGLSRWQVRR